MAVDSTGNHQLSRRGVLKSAGVLGGSALLFGHVSGFAAGSSHNGPVAIDNGTLAIDFDPQLSVEWQFEGVDQLFDELYAFQWGDATVTNSEDDGTVVDSYPENGVPGEWYSSTIEYGLGDAELSVDRQVRLHETDALIQINYVITNTSEVDVDDLRFYQYVDFDIFGSSDDEGHYVADGDYVYQFDSSEGRTDYLGFMGSATSVNHEVDAYSGTRVNTKSGSLNGQDSYSGDATAALEWALGPLNGGETTEIGVNFAAAHTLEDIEGLLPQFAVDPDCADRRSLGRGDEMAPCEDERRNWSRDDVGSDDPSPEARRRRRSR